MRNKHIIFASLFIFFNHVFIIPATNENRYPHAIITSKMTGSIIAGAIGDALGRVTEFIQSTDAIFAQYPHGVRTFDDFLDRDWANVPSILKNSHTAPYTDDTAMTLLVLQELIKARENSWDLNTTMDNIARSFVADAQNPMGWKAPFRAPGNACIAGVQQLSNRLKNNKLSSTWWIVDAPHAGGCGSVMRAHPFGLIFADNPEKAALWAAEHSKLTHGAPLALAACAAMAIGTAYAIQGKEVEFIVQKMIAAAEQYDTVTANKIEEAYRAAQIAKKLKAPFNIIFAAYKNYEFKNWNDHIFSTFLGWAAHDAIAATVYAFTLSPDNVMEAIYLGVHTPGDSDSIASMAGALVGARLGIDHIPDNLINQLENSSIIQYNAIKTAVLFEKSYLSHKDYKNE